MTNLALYGRLSLVIVMFLSIPAFAVEPDEGGIGGTGISKPKPNDEIFDRPDIPDIIDIPEAIEHDIPELDGVQDDAAFEFSSEDVATPADAEK